MTVFWSLQVDNSGIGRGVPRIAFSIACVLPHVVAVVDEFRHQSAAVLTLTNGAEYLIQYLAGEGLLAGRRVIYRDTEGLWDEIALQNGEVCFAPIGVRDLNEAILAVTPSIGTG